MSRLPLRIVDSRSPLEALRSAFVVGGFSAVALAIATVIRAAFAAFPAGTLTAVSIAAGGGFVSGFASRIAFRLFRRLGSVGAILTACVGVLTYMLTMATGFGHLSSIGTLFFVLTAVYGVAVGWFIVLPLQKRAVLAEAAPRTPE